MTDAQRRASIVRHARFLTPVERKAFEPTEAELIAIDHAVNFAKKSGAWDRIRDRFALQAELNSGGRS